MTDGWPTHGSATDPGVNVGRQAGASQTVTKVRHVRRCTSKLGSIELHVREDTRSRSASALAGVMMKDARFVGMRVLVAELRGKRILTPRCVSCVLLTREALVG